MMNLLTAVFVTFVALSNAHDWNWGSCPAVSSQPNISIDKFLGLWYVIEQFDTGSSCYVYNYTRVSPTQLKVTKGRQYDMIIQAGLNHTNSYTGSLDIPSDSDQGRLRVKWPLNILGKGDYIIVGTDYTTYAGVYDCQQVTYIGHRQSAAILSRTPELEQIYVDKIKNRLLSFGVDGHDFDKVSHEDCLVPSKATINVNIDDSTLKTAIGVVTDGVKDIGKKIATETTGLWNAGRRGLGFDDSTDQTNPQNLLDSDVEIIQ